MFFYFFDVLISTEIIVILKTAVDSVPKQLNPSIGTGFQPILATVQQFQMGELNNVQKPFFDRCIQPTCRVNCRF
jgi:hypothetical protein